MAKKYKPFATSRQSSDWINRNCDSCKEGFEYTLMGGFRCRWEKALCWASLRDGQISGEVAKAIGYLDSEGCDLWECPGWARR